MANRKIIRYPQASLKDPCTPVSFPLSAELLEHIGDLKDTLAAIPHGAALASNQILGRGHRVFVVRPGYGLLDVVINPKYDPIGDGTIEEMESCLSIPELSVVTRRHDSVYLRWQDANGEMFAGEFGHMAARIIQHECDHLEGKLLADRLNSKDRAKLRVRAFNNRKAGR